MTLSEFLIYLIGTLTLNQICTYMRTRELREKLETYNIIIAETEDKFYKLNSKYRELETKYDDREKQIQSAYIKQRLERDRL